MAAPDGDATGNLLCDALGRPIPGLEPPPSPPAPSPSTGDGSLGSASSALDTGGQSTELADLLAQVAAASDDGPRWAPLILLKPPGLDTIINTIKPPLQVISALLQVVAAFLDVLSAILIGLLDPYRALVLAAYTLLKNLIDDLIHAGFYLYYDAAGLTSIDKTPSELGFPETPKELFLHGMAGEPAPRPMPDRFAKWASRFAESFDDPGDKQRPILSNGASVAAVFIVAAAPSLEALRQAIFLIGSFANIKLFETAVTKYKKGVPDPDLSRARMHSVAPDWKAARLMDLFPPKYPFTKLAALPEMLRKLLLQGQGLTGLLKDMAAAIQAKVKALQDLIAAIQAIIDFLDALRSAGLYALPVFGSQGPEGLKQAFVQAKNRPPGGYIGGACFLAAGPGIADAAVLFNLLNPANAKDNFKILEKAWDETKQSAKDAADKAHLKDKWYGLGDAAKKAKKDLADTIEKAPGKFAKDFGEGAEAIHDAVENAPGDFVDMAKKAKKKIVDEPIQRADEAVKQARKKGPRSLALGLGAAPDLRTPPKKSEEPPGGGSGGGSP